MEKIIDRKSIVLFEYETIINHKNEFTLEDLHNRCKKIMAELAERSVLVRFTSNFIIETLLLRALEKFDLNRIIGPGEYESFFDSIPNCPKRNTLKIKYTQDMQGWPFIELDFTGKEVRVKYIGLNYPSRLFMMLCKLIDGVFDETNKFNENYGDLMALLNSSISEWEL